jgi:hypothetical protein
MNKVNWTAVAVFSIVVVIVFLVGVSLLGGRNYGGWGMMGPGGMGPGMMGGWSFGLVGWIGMILMWLIPIGLVILVVAGIVWVVRSIGSGGTPAPTRACPNCGRFVQADWKNCPYCGEGLD